MKLPKTIKIGHLTYTLNVVKDLTVRGLKCFGSHDGNLKIISIDDSIENTQVTKETILHESMHALWDHFDLPTKNEEHTISCLSKGFLMLIVDNPKLLKYLGERE